MEFIFQLFAQYLKDKELLPEIDESPADLIADNTAENVSETESDEQNPFSIFCFH